jgi:hypothetical protein
VEDKRRVMRADGIRNLYLNLVMQLEIDFLNLVF